MKEERVENDRKVKEERVENDRKGYAPLEGIATLGAVNMLRVLWPSMSLLLLLPLPHTTVEHLTSRKIKDKKRQKDILTYFTNLLTAFRLLLN